MNSLSLHGRKLESIFELLGSQENDITYSLGWVLANCPSFLNAFTHQVFPRASRNADYQINLQHFQRDKGITDVEIFSEELHVIIEAKRGWSLPQPRQLEKYARKLRSSESKRKALVVMSECSGVYAAHQLQKERRCLIFC